MDKIKEKTLHVLFGGGGFIGTNIYNNLLEENDHFLIIDKFDNSQDPDYIKLKKNAPKEIKHNISYLVRYLNFIGDDQPHKNIVSHILNLVFELEEKADKVYVNFYHLASTVGVKNNQKSNFSEEMIITQNIIRIIKNFQIDLVFNERKNILIKNIWYTSTSELYGNNSSDIEKSGLSDKKIKEKYTELSSLYSVENPNRSHYIYQKYLSERLFQELEFWCENHKTIIEFTPSVEILTLFNVVGCFQDVNKGVFNKFVFNILSGIDCEVGSSTRRYIPVNLITDFIKFKNKNFANSSNFLYGSNKCLSCTGKELFTIMKLALMQMYPNFEDLIIKSNCIELDNSIKEIDKRFDSNFDGYGIDNFIKTYGSQIKDQVDYWKKMEVLIEEDELKKLGSSYIIEDIIFRVKEFYKKDNTVLLKHNLDMKEILKYSNHIIRLESGEEILLTKITPTMEKIFGILLDDKIENRIINKKGKIIGKINNIILRHPE